MTERGLRWYQREPQAFLDGVQGMGPELIGAYAVLLDLIYARAGETRRDDRHLSGLLGCSARKASALTDELLKLGKLSFRDGFITNSRAFREAKSARDERETKSKAGRKGGENSARLRKNKDLGQAAASSRTQADKSRVEESRVPVSEDTGQTAEILDFPERPPDIPEMAEPPPLADPAKVMFEGGLALLAAAGKPEGQARSILGKWRKAHGAEAVISALGRAQREGAIDPVGFVEGVFRASAPKSRPSEGDVRHLPSGQEQFYDSQLGWLDVRR